MTARRNRALVLLAGIVGAGIGLLVAHFTRLAHLPPVGSTRLPYPYVVPRTEGDVALRLAMVHDVLHERFPRHGPAYYKERNRLCRQSLAALKAPAETGRPPQKYFDLLDDLAVGLDQTGEYEEAIRVMRDKLLQQLKLGVPRTELYSTYANLGTFLILGPFRHVRPGNESDKQVLREGLKDIQTAVEINPNSHFGREPWQVAIIEYMIALYGNPEVLLQFDMVGNGLDAKVDGTGRSPMADFGITTSAAAGPRHHRVDLAIKKSAMAADYLQHPESWDRCREVRQLITKVGAEEGWNKAVASEHNQPVPFDEPTLGIVGMWRMGGGAHPYFAVALGETMLRVGERHLAWSAFERAGLMAKFTWPDPLLQQRFKEHCRRRQAAIEATLPAGEIGALRPAFDAELALGLAYQKAYQQYEEQSIASFNPKGNPKEAGKSIEDPHFYDDFHAHHKSIASPASDADSFHTSKWWMPSWSVVMALLLAGVFALVAAGWLPRDRRPRHSLPV